MDFRPWIIAELDMALAKIVEKKFKQAQGNNNASFITINSVSISETIAEA